MSSVSAMADVVVKGKKKYILVPKQHEFYYNNKNDSEKKRKSHVLLYVLPILLLCFAIYARFFAGDEDHLDKLELATSEMKIAKEWIDMAKEKVASLSFIRAVLFGLTTTIFTWMVVFFDSALPGKCPPSPLSPGKLRKQTGHIFHSGYALAVVNGFVCTFLLCWM